MERAPTPYVKGARFTIYRHVPPKPTARDYHICKKKDLDEQKTMTFAERSQLHPALPGVTLQSEAMSITITDEIAVSTNHGAQVVGVNGDLVAKFYDPQYYPMPTLWNDVGVDPIRCADFHYTHEASAYERVSGPYGGTIVPRYHGSYTCELPISSCAGETTRSIRLVLMERIHGTCMRDLGLSGKQLSQQQRQNIMAKIVDAESLLFGCALSTGDFHPRNILLCGDDLGSASLRVVIIDFGNSVLDYPDPSNDSGLPTSPLLRWDVRRGDHKLCEEFEWVDWDWQAWLEERWTGSEAYAPVTDRAKTYWFGYLSRMVPDMPL
ncbi:hypothetical protein MMC16_006207 [Acarospora aff. strigata]|nr:hypothetical protein [Acarospora aff. strigata]